MLLAAPVLGLALALGPCVRSSGGTPQLFNGAHTWSRSHMMMVSTESSASSADIDCEGPECGIEETALTTDDPPATGGGATIDLRRGRTGAVGSAPAEQRSYGVDPRKFKGKPEKEAEDLAAAKAEEPHPTASTLPEIQPLRSVSELEAALQKAGDKKLVVIKFYARWCKSCKAIKPRFERVATKLSDTCDFYEVDYAAHKAFCERCNVRFMPCVHVYKNGQLATSTSLSVQRFNDFADQLEVDAAKMRA